MSIKNNSSGSIWRKWDLHFHTPASFDYKNKNITAEAIVANLIASGLSAVAITDHHVMDPDFIKQMQDCAGDQLTVFPGIELRSELGGSKCVHYIGIFPETVDVSQLWASLEVKLGITAREIEEKSLSDETIYVDFKKGADVIHELGGLVSVHAGTKSNGIEEIVNAERFKQEFKTDLLNDYVDILEIGKVDDRKGYREIVFKEIGFELPIIICSDNHNAANYKPRADLWIKADCTLLGLKQTLIEPSQRVCIGSKPDLLTQAETNRTKYLDKLSIKKVPGSKLTEHWFNHSIPFNHGLVAIIGNKGGGKSALADIIGLLGDCGTQDDFSFLTRKKFCDPKNLKASEFTAELLWHSSQQSPNRTLDYNIPEGTLESVKYIPQSYLERICSDYDSGASDKFDKELSSVIYSHVPESERLEMPTLEKLLSYKTDERKATLSLARDRVSGINRKIASIEKRMSPQNLKELEEKRDERKRALEAHDLNVPDSVPEPVKQSQVGDDPNKETRQAIAQLEKQIEELSKEHDTLLRDKNSHTVISAKITRLGQKISNFEEQYRQFKIEWNSEAADLSLPVEDVVHVTVNRQQLDELKESTREKLQGIDEQLDESNEESIAYRLKTAQTQIKESKALLDAPTKAYEEFKEKLAIHTKKRNGIVGDADAVGSLKYFEAEIEKLRSLPKTRDGLLDQRDLELDSIFGELQSLLEDYRLLYRGVQEFIDKHPIAAKRGLTFDVSVREVGFTSRLMEMIDTSRKGKLRGKDDANRKIQDKVDTADFTTFEGVKNFTRSIMGLLGVAEDEAPNYDKFITQLRQNRTVEEIYDYIFGLEFLDPHYQLTWNNKSLNQLSPGERGTLLLIFYLLVDKGDIPLIIDQPEENLDNQTIYEILVQCIVEAKQRRQLILVTHNPNLAVVCDAEQVIHASLDKSNNYTIAYSSGALENPHINTLVLDILEGTRPAFSTRDKKYKLPKLRAGMHQRK